MKAIVKRSFRHGDDKHAKGASIDIPESQFDDWKAAGLVKAAPLDAGEGDQQATTIPAGKAKIAKPA